MITTLLFPFVITFAALTRYAHRNKKENNTTSLSAVTRAKNRELPPRTVLRILTLEYTPLTRDCACHIVTRDTCDRVQLRPYSVHMIRLILMAYTHEFHRPSLL